MHLAQGRCHTCDTDLVQCEIVDDSTHIKVEVNSSIKTTEKDDMNRFDHRPKTEQINEAKKM